MPSAEVILNGLAAIANEWRSLAISWHVYFAALVAAFLTQRPPTRVIGALLVIPLISVSVLAWSSQNWFNGVVFAALAALLARGAVRMSSETEEPAVPAALITGALLFLFGFVYPHFVATDSWATRMYAAPLGLLPCPTLSVLIGMTLMFGLFREREWSPILAAVGLLYGAIGVFRLGVTIDIVLVGGSAVLAIAFIASARRSIRASDVEQHLFLPGDILIPAPLATITHAITIHRPRRDVWPWLAQMGAGRRAGWYSYDFLDNGRRPSASRIVPELQHLRRGMIFPALPKITDGFTLLSFEPDRSLVLGWGPPGREPVVTWAFHLVDADMGDTRLVVRVAGGQDYRFHGLPAFLTKPLVRLVHFIMQRRQLLGIARRAEMSWA